MNIEETIKNRRTIRRFKQEPLSLKTLKTLIKYARLAPSGSNIQSISYIIIKDPEMCNKIFPLIKWAGSLPESERMPPEGQRPTAYIIVLNNFKIKKKAEYDIGAAIQNILLGAIEYNIGSCWMGSINRKKIRILFNVEKKYNITHVISLGIPAEESNIEPYDGSFKYWKDKDGLMYVPKKSLEDVIYAVY